MSDDALLDCLVSLSRIVGRPTSAHALVAGLPLTEHGLTLDLLPRAAAHLELQANFQAFPLKNNPIHFPVPIILILHDDKACLLTDITPYNSLRIISPQTGEPREVSFEELAATYTGNAFVIEPTFRFSSQSSVASYESDEKNWFWASIKKLWFSYSEMLVASFIINLFALSLPLFTMVVYDKVVPNRSFDSLWVLSSGIMIIFIFDFMMRALRSYFIDAAGKKVDLEVSATILERVMGIKMADRPASVGAFSNTIQSFDAVREFITSTTVTILIDLPFAILFVVIIGIIGGPLIWVMIILLPLSVIVGFLMQKPLMDLTKIAYRYAAEKQAILFEILNGIETVKTDCAENIMQARWEQVVNLSAKAGIRLRTLINNSMFFSIFLQQFTIVAIMIFGVYQISQNQLTTGALVACSLLASRAIAPMSRITSLLTSYQQTATSLDSLNNIMTLPVERPIGASTIHVVALRGEIEFKDVNFHYPTRKHPVLEKISFSLKPGEHLGIIGRIGSGKSTLAKLMLSLLQPSAGTIYFDGVDQRNLDVGELRHSIGYVPQDVTLFYGTLRDNITFGSPHVSDENLMRAIKVSGIDELIKPHLGGYETMISEGGKNLSGGQRRVISIARAILLDPPIFVLDEPSHSMDQQTEDFLKEKLNTYLQSKTVIMMTHRPSLLSLVDRVILIDDGKILMDGQRDVVVKALSEGKIGNS